VSFGLGPIGLAIADALLDREGIELVGALDARDDLVGRDLGEFLSREPTGVVVGNDLGSVLDKQIAGVVVQATSSRLEDVAAQLEPIIDLGWNVLSTSEELTCPSAADRALASAIDGMAQEGGVTVIGAGVNPGFVMDVLPLLLSGLCLRVDSVAVRRIVDTNQRRPQLQTKVGVGLTADEFHRRVQDRRLGHVGLRQSTHLIATALGWDTNEYSETIEPVLAPEGISAPIGPVAAGDASGVRQVATLRADGRERVQLHLEMYAGAEPEDRIEITGEPSFLQIVPGGLNGDIATAALIANLVPAVQDARPGLLTMSELLPLACAQGRRAVLNA
jgi:4-hydroxy-tetrahydrodipicolinate reductase